MYPYPQTILCFWPTKLPKQELKGELYIPFGFPISAPSSESLLYSIHVPNIFQTCHSFYLIPNLALYIGKTKIRCEFVSFSCLQRQHHSGPTKFLFCKISQVKDFVIQKKPHEHFGFCWSHLNFQTCFHHQTWRFSLPSLAKALYPMLGT
jgi:hypothetical protein